MFDGERESEEIIHEICRFNYPQYPMEKTTFVPRMTENIDEE